METMQTLTVSELSRQIKDVIEGNFPRVSIVGEISNLSRASSGHVYLTLKDQQAQIRAVLWRSTASRLKFDIEDGLEVVATGAVEVYAPRGSYQLIIRSIQPQGIGALELAFRQLQEKLAGEGLFDPEHKRELPTFPRRIALITSPTGAAVRDMLQVMTRRWPLADIAILPVAVQGNLAATQIAEAFEIVPRIPDVDVVITGRGGGSLEDLWPFNEEMVARAIHRCPIPVISAVGHEVDVSISDFVADRRALTPSEAAELVVPSAGELVGFLESCRSRLQNQLRDHCNQLRKELENIAQRRVLEHPEDLIHVRSQEIDDLSGRILRAVTNRLSFEREQVRSMAGSMDALSPLRVLARGYSMTTDSDGHVLKSIEDSSVGQEITTRLSDGVITGSIQRIERLSEG